MPKTTKFRNEIPVASPGTKFEIRNFQAVGLIFCATLAAYYPAVKAGFIWNDGDYVTTLSLRSVEGLRRIWFELGATEQYYPLLHSAFWVEHRLWGDAALGYHLVNILLHATSACLLMLVLKKIRSSKFEVRDFQVPLLAALLFALHPVYVESVAWISEQKNTLSTAFYLLAALAYLNFDETRLIHLAAESAEQSDALSSWRSLRSLRPKAWGWYFIALVLFILALMTKTVVATLPGALLVVLWWQRGRLSWQRDVLPLIPWFAIGAASGLFSAWVERTYVGAQGSDFGLSGLERCLLAGRGVWFYLGKLVWPADLIFIYPRWTVSAGDWVQYLYPAGVVALVAALWLIRKRTRGPLAAVLFFLGSLFPVCGFFNLYAFIYSYVADHWQYLPSVGIMVLAAAGWGRWENSNFELRNSKNGNPANPKFEFRISKWPQITAAAVICGLGVLTFRQCGLYNDIETFYNRTIAKNPGCWMAHTNLGIYLAATGRPREAIDHYEQALRLDPYRPEVIHNYLGRVLLDTGHAPEAIAEFEEALRLDGSYFKPHFNLGDAYFQERRLPEAIVQFEDAVRIDGKDPVARNDLAVALAETGRVPEAISQFEETLRLRPDYAEAHNNLGIALLRQRRLPEAKAEFEQALRLKPDYPGVREKLLEIQAAMP